jgi:hypothetical protein
LRKQLSDPRRFAVRVSLAVVVLALLLFAWQSWRVASGLSEARDRVEPLQDAIVKGDVKSARQRLARLDEATTRAHHASDGPLWWLGSKIPLVGRNVGAVRTISRELDAITDDALPAIVDVADQVRLETFRPRHGRVNLTAVAKALPVLKKTDRVLAHADAEVGAIQANRLVGPLQAPIRDLQERTHSAAVGASSAADVSSLMPGMLGADGSTRRYLMLVLNNAETRSLSGMPGSVAVITAKDGKLKMGRQGGFLDVGVLGKPARSIKPELRAGFLSDVGADVRDTTMLPEFPRAAELAASIVGEKWDEKFDGVVAVDPVALGYALGGLGPVSIGGGLTINQYNAASTLLHQIYVKYPNEGKKQDDAFEFAARRSFDSLMSGRGNSVATIRGLVRGVRERRVLLWSRDASEQRRILTGGIAGALSMDRATPEVGSFVNDAGSWKMTYYLHTSAKLEARKCLDGNAQQLRLTTTLQSNGPQSVRRMSPSVVGHGEFVRPGDMRLHPLIVGPLGGQITALRVDGQRAPVGGNTYHGRPLTRVARVLPPGETTVIVVDMVTPRGSTGQPILRLTPAATPNEISVSPGACSTD